MKRILFFSLFLASLNLWASEDHDHHDDHEKTEHKDEHAAHQDEEPNADGFKLNEKSTKKFGIQTLSVKEGTIDIPRDAIFKGLNEVNVYRLRDGFYKRIDFKTLEAKKDGLKISSSDLKVGDQIVTAGVGFLRIAEIAASGGISDSHSH